MTNIEKWPMAFDAQGIPKVGGRWGWNSRAITIKAPMAHGSCEVLFDDGMKAMWCTKDFEYNSVTFLGFSDSAPVNQGAAAPQKLPEGWTPQDAMICVVCFSAAMAGCSACGRAACTQHLATAMAHGGHCPRRAKSAPLVAPPPSLKAAVQQEGLSIPKQPWVRHEQWEEDARAYEKDGDLGRAKVARQNAQEKRAADLAYDAEAAAIRENRIVRKDALREMGAGDRRCFDLRGLREFEAIKSVEHAKWNWWAR